MKQYLQLGKEILKSAPKGQAREHMPDTLSLFGHQMRFNLQEGFPLLTTKEVNFKHIVTELLWFLRGDSNIQFLVDNGCGIWNEDAYNYYVKLCKRDSIEMALSFKNFTKHLKGQENEFIGVLELPKGYRLGDTGKQYPWLWRKWKGEHIFGDGEGEFEGQGNRYISGQKEVDQIKNLINTLTTNPNSRRHILSAWNPLTLDEMALPACHSFVQFNCRPISMTKRYEIWNSKTAPNITHYAVPGEGINNDIRLDNAGVPKYYLDCQLYQRSGDYFLGVPYNIASYALLTEILSEITDMVPGDFVHTFGDVHIYSTHLSQVETQLQREPRELPKLVLAEEAKREIKRFKDGEIHLNGLLQSMEVGWFTVSNYNPAEPIKGKLSTGLK